MNRVLITRPEPGATQTAARVASLGLIPVVAPVLSIVARTIRPPKRVAAVLLTSRNAIASCPPAFRDRPVFAVGSATGACATKAGFIHVLSADGDASTLAALVANTLSPSDGTLFLPTAQGQGAKLVASLRQSGFHVLRRVAYQAVGVTALPEAAVDLLRDNDLAFAMFFSGETAHHFVRLVRAKMLAEAVHNVAAVSISEQAAVALRPLHWRRVSVATKPNQDAMLALLK